MAKKTSERSHALKNPDSNPGHDQIFSQISQQIGHHWLMYLLVLVIITFQLLTLYMVVTNQETIKHNQSIIYQGITGKSIIVGP